MPLCPIAEYWGFRHPCSCTPRTYNESELYLNNLLRSIWEQHVVWTRMTIISMIMDLPDVNLVTQRLLKNAEDMRDALIPYYGGKISSQFGELIKQHLIIAAELVKAAKAGDSKATADAEKKWYANADEIAAFLSKINPYWQEEHWKSMLHEHLALTKSEAVQILNKNYSEGIKIYDEIEKQALKMADDMFYGIITLFPARFSN